MIKEVTDLVFAAVNFHVPECGLPPDIRDDGSSPTYYGYFVNRYGEQWTLAIDATSKSGVLRGGDLGWERRVQIADGRVDEDLVLSQEERQWLDACWQAACGEPLAS